MFAFNIEILKKSFPKDVQTKGSYRVAGIRRTPLTKGDGYEEGYSVLQTAQWMQLLG